MFLAFVVELAGQKARRGRKGLWGSNLVYVLLS